MRTLSLFCLNKTLPFESYMLHYLIDFLKTNDNQFGFKPNYDTVISVFLLKQVASFFIYLEILLFLDASKAFDKVYHDLLFKKLIVRNVPLYFIRLFTGENSNDES